MSHVTDMMLLCRLCSIKDDVNVPIFGEDADVLPKILACLPVKVSLEDNLPKKICDVCFGNLESYYRFRNKAAETEKQLLNLLSQAEQSLTDTSFTTEQSQIDTIFIKTEFVDVSERISETSSKTHDFSTKRLGNNCVEEKTNKPTEDEKLSEVDEPLSKRRKKSDTLQIKTDKDFSGNSLSLNSDINLFENSLNLKSDINLLENSLNLTSNITANAKIEVCEVEDCEGEDVMDQPEPVYIESINNEEELESRTSDELQFGTSGIVLSVNDALCTKQEDDENNQIDPPEDPSNVKVKDCVVVLGDLENVNVKKYQFVKQTITDLKSISPCTLVCYSCGANFGSAVSSYINHLITEHSESEGDDFTDENNEEVASEERIIISCQFCSNTFEDEDSLQKHLTVVHPYSCGRCNRVFMNVHQSLLHTKMHFIMDKRKPEEKQKKPKVKTMSEQKVKKELIQTKEVAKQIMEEMRKIRVEVKRARETKEEVKQTKEGTKQIKEEGKQTKEGTKQIKEEAKQTEEGVTVIKEEVTITKEEVTVIKEGPKQTTTEGAKQTEMNRLPQQPVKRSNEPQKNYSCTECDSKFEDCYQLQRHRVWKHRRKPEKRYEYIKLYKCVLCAKHYPSQQMLDDHKTTHLVDVRSAVEETGPKPKESQGPKPKESQESKTEKTHLSKLKGTTLLKLLGDNQVKPKETNQPKSNNISAVKKTESPLLLIDDDDDDIIEINSDENKKPNLDETGDILDNVEIICNDIEFDNEDTTSTSNEAEQSQNLNLASEMTSLVTIESKPTQLLTGTAEAPLQTQNAFPQINFIHPPPLVLPNLNQTVTKFVQVLPGNCSIITMPKNSGTVAKPNFTTNHQNQLSNTNNPKQIKLIHVDNSQACAVNNTPIVLNKYLKQNVEPVFQIKTNVNSTIKFRQIKPKLQIVSKKTTIPDSVNKKGVEEVITLIIEKEMNASRIDTSKKKEQEIETAVKPVETTNREESNSKLLESANSGESNSKLREAIALQESKLKLIETIKPEPNSCIKIESSDSSESDNNNKEQSDNKTANQSEDIIEIDSSSDESKSEENSQQTSEFRLICAICNRRHSARHITMKYQIYICIWCNYTISVITKKIELFDKFKSPLATGILTTLGRVEFFKSHIQCNICKIIQAESEYKYKTTNSLVVCNLCKLKTASVTAILLSIREKARYNNNKRTEQNKFCKVTCETCGIAVRIQTITYFNNKIVVCDSCRPKLFEIAAVSSGIYGKTGNIPEEDADNVLLQTQCYICKDMKHVNNISLLNDKSMCNDCKFNVSNFAIFLNILQKPKRCLNCKKLKKGLQLQELSTYCSKCLDHRPNACLKCDKSGSLGQCSCKKSSEEKVKNTETEISEDEDKLVIDIESENKTEDKKQEGKVSTRRQSNGSSSSSIEILETAEESSVSQESTEDAPSTSSTNMVPKIFLKPMHSLLEPATLLQKETREQKFDTFTCFYCSLVCFSKAALAIHKDNVHLCRICKKYRENVHQHLKNIVKCQICQTVFCKKFSLGDHYRQKHDSRWCAICDTVLRDDYEVLLHRKIVHNQS